MQQSIFPTVHDHMLFAGLPDRIPYTPSVNCRPTMSQNVNTIMVMLMQNVQTQPNSTFLRQALFYRMSANNWNNNDFNALLSETVEYIDLAMTTNPQANIGQTAQAACSDMVDYYAAMEVFKDQRLQPLLQPQQINDINRLVAEYQELGVKIQQFVNSTQQQQQTNTGLLTLGGGNANTGTRQLSGGGGLSLNNSGSNATRGGVSAGGLLSSRIAGGTGAVNVQPRSSMQLRQTETLQSNLNNNTPLGNINVNQGNEIPQVAGSDYSILGRVHPIVFDPRYHRAFYRRRQGNDGYLNHLMSKENDMNYDLHQTRHLLSPRIRLPEPKVVLKAHNTAQERLVNELLEKLSGDHVVADIMPDLSFDLYREPDYLAFSGQFHDDFRAFAAGNEIPEIDLEAVGVVARFVHFEILGYSPTTAEKLVEAAKSSTCAKMADRLLRLQEGMSMHHWTMIDRRCTAHLNEWLFRQSADMPAVDSFCYHINKLVDLLAAEYPEVLDDLDTHFLEELVQQTLNIDNGQLYADMMGNEELNLPRLATYETALLIPATAQQFHWSCAGNVGTVTKHSLPELHELIEKAALFSDPKCRYVKLVTLDNVVSYLYKTADKHVFLLGNTCDFSNKD